MPTLTINGNSYQYPNAGSEPGYGQEASDWAQAVTDQLNSISGEGSINETLSTIDLAVSNKAVAGLAFNAAILEGADVSYRMTRHTDSQELAEKGTLHIVYNAGTVEKWYISREITAGTDCQVRFDIDTTGQVTYTSEAIAGTNYTGSIKFKTSTILKT